MQCEEVHVNITVETKSKSKKDIALKLHRQFAHAEPARIINLLKKAGAPWNTDNELFQELERLSESCETCARYSRPPRRPAVGLPLAEQFLECVSFDLKFMNHNNKQKIIIHFIDQATRFGAAAVIPNKNPETIIGAIMKHWIGIFGSASKFHTDNGGEFVNENMIELGQKKFGILISTTAAYSPWSNGTIERHNLVIAEMIHKVISDTNCNFDVALAWAINAKNSLANIHGFTPYQLVMGQNPQLPSILNDHPPSFSTKVETSRVLAEHLQALHAAREAFVQADNSQRIKRALTKNVRSYTDAVFLPGDKVIYHRPDSSEWRGTATVLCKNGQTVLLKHGGHYVRVHPCRVSHYPPLQNDAAETHDAVAPVTSRSSNSPVPVYEDDDEDFQNHHAPDNSSVPDNAPVGNAEVETPAEAVRSNVTSVTSTESAPADIQSIEPVSTQPTTSAATTPANNTTNSKKSAKKKPVTLSAGNVISIDFPNRRRQIYKIHSRAGKATASLSQAYNMYDSAGTLHCINLKDAVSWHIINDNEHDCYEVVTTEFTLAATTEDIAEAKSQELQIWRDHEVFTEVDDMGQDRISTRWVLDYKEKDGNCVAKARLCARGFEEEQPFRTDSPTCTRESTRLAFIIIASNKWDAHSIDIKRAFLQGKAIEREVYLQPPPEAKTKKLWLLRKCVYGLADAPREFYK